MEKNNSTEDYLESILILHKNKGFARSVDVAKELGVTRPSVSSAMKKLMEKEMIYFSDKGHIFFTDAGKAIAEKVYRKHLMISGSHPGARSPWSVMTGTGRCLFIREIQ